VCRGAFAPRQLVDRCSDRSRGHLCTAAGRLFRAQHLGSIGSELNESFAEASTPTAFFLCLHKIAVAICPLRRAHDLTTSGAELPKRSDRFMRNTMGSPASVLPSMLL